MSFTILCIRHYKTISICKPLSSPKCDRSGEERCTGETDGLLGDWSELPVNGTVFLMYRYHNDGPSF
jgi:hypothetical protein